MIWVGVAIGTVMLVSLVLVALARGRRDADDEPQEEVDPMFITGITLAGTGVALALTLGPIMYGMMIIGLIVMAIGANRTQHRHH